MPRPDRDADWTLSRFLIATWNGPGVDGPAQRAAGLAAAGMNTVRWSLAELDALLDAGMHYTPLSAVGPC